MALGAAPVAHYVKILAALEAAAPALMEFPDTGGFTACGGILAEATPLHQCSPQMWGHLSAAADKTEVKQSC